MFVYILLKQDGTQEELDQSQHELHFDEFHKWLNCQTIELIPQPYYQEDWGDCKVYGDEEGRFNSENKRNPHTKVLKGNPALGEVAEWDCVGDLILEQEV